MLSVLDQEDYACAQKLAKKLSETTPENVVKELNEYHNEHFCAIIFINLSVNVAAEILSDFPNFFLKKVLPSLLKYVWFKAIDFIAKAFDFMFTSKYTRTHPNSIRCVYLYFKDDFSKAFKISLLAQMKPKNAAKIVEQSEEISTLLDDQSSATFISDKQLLKIYKYLSKSK